jgi:hypothetical protein
MTHLDHRTALQISMAFEPLLDRAASASSPRGGGVLIGRTPLSVPACIALPYCALTPLNAKLETRHARRPNTSFG